MAGNYHHFHWSMNEKNLVGVQVVKEFQEDGCELLQVARTTSVEVKDCFGCWC